MDPGFQPDLVVRTPSGQPVAVVEVKNRQDLTPDVAAALRRNLVVHGDGYRAPFFLFVSQDVGYLWDQRSPILPDARPTVRFPMDGVVARYLPDATQLGRLPGGALELIVGQWLSDLSDSIENSDIEPERSLVGTGLLDALAGAEVLSSVAA